MSDISVEIHSKNNFLVKADRGKWGRKINRLGGRWNGKHNGFVVPQTKKDDLEKLFGKTLDMEDGKKKSPKKEEREEEREEEESEDDAPPPAKSPKKEHVVSGGRELKRSPTGRPPKKETPVKEYSESENEENEEEEEEERHSHRSRHPRNARDSRKDDSSDDDSTPPPKRYRKRQYEDESDEDVPSSRREKSNKPARRDSPDSESDRPQTPKRRARNVTPKQSRNVTPKRRDTRRDVKDVSSESEDELVGDSRYKSPVRRISQDNYDDDIQSDNEDVISLARRFRYSTRTIGDLANRLRKLERR